MSVQYFTGYLISIMRLKQICKSFKSMAIIALECQNLERSYINDLPYDVICNIAIYADDTTLYSKCDQASDLWQQLELASELESDLQHTVDWGKK